MELAAWLLAGLILGGCGPAADITVAQTELAGTAARLELRSRWAFFDAGQTDRYLAGFPFPGAVAGERQYVLYLVCDPGPGEKKVDADLGAGDARRAAGFFVQERGRHAGLTRITKGTVRIRGVPFAGRKRRQVEVAVRCDDGTVLTGRLLAVASLLELRDFQEGPHAADVAALLADYGDGQPAPPAVR